MRNIFPTAALVALAACQTIPAQGGLSQRQVTVLRDMGFKPVGEHWELGLPERLLFAVDESRLLPDQGARMGDLARKLAEVGIRGARIEGHTDSTGSTGYNMQLSARRAEAVKAALAGGGMMASAIRAIGRGEAAPIESNATAAGRQQNRRVVIIVAAADAAPR